jgi:hypothetical protein
MLTYDLVSPCQSLMAASCWSESSLVQAVQVGETFSRFRDENGAIRIKEVDCAFCYSYVNCS